MNFVSLPQRQVAPADVDMTELPNASQLQLRSFRRTQETSSMSSSLCATYIIYTTLL